MREGLDLPEVSLVAILDADKEGFLRSHRSLTQTAGRAARNLNGLVIMYADKITESMQMTIDETNRRREKQLAYNEAHGITPQAIQKSFANVLSTAPTVEKDAYVAPEVIPLAADPVVQYMTPQALQKSIDYTRRQMMDAAKEMNFIEAAQLRDELIKLEDQLKQMQSANS